MLIDKQIVFRLIFRIGLRTDYTNTHTHTHTHIYIYIYINIYIYILAANETREIVRSKNVYPFV